IEAMLSGDKHRHATFSGEHASVRDARNVPKPIQQPRVPIMVGGNGPTATCAGERAGAGDGRNAPKPIQQPRVPIMVGGNGPNVTWRLAARHADEVNVDGMAPDEVAEALPVIRSRCEEARRDPATLKVSVHVWKSDFGVAGPARVELLAAYQELGISRVMGLDPACTTSDEALESLSADARAAGVTLAWPCRGG